MTERAPATHITLPVDSGKLTNRQVWLLVLCGFAILFDGADIFMIGLAAPSIAASLKLKMASLGPVFGISQAGIMLGALLFGPAADRFGRRRLVIFTTAIAITEDHRSRAARNGFLSRDRDGAVYANR